MGVPGGKVSARASAKDFLKTCLTGLCFTNRQAGRRGCTQAPASMLERKLYECIGRRSDDQRRATAFRVSSFCHSDPAASALERLAALRHFDGLQGS